MISGLILAVYGQTNMLADPAERFLNYWRYKPSDDATQETLCVRIFFKKFEDMKAEFKADLNTIQKEGVLIDVYVCNNEDSSSDKTADEICNRQRKFPMYTVSYYNSKTKKLNSTNSFNYKSIVGTSFVADFRKLARDAPKIDRVEAKKDSDVLEDRSSLMKSGTQPKTEVMTPEVDQIITGEIQRLSDDLKKQTEDMKKSPNDPLFHNPNRLPAEPVVKTKESYTPAETINASNSEKKNARFFIPDRQPADVLKTVEKSTPMQDLIDPESNKKAPRFGVSDREESQKSNQTSRSQSDDKPVATPKQSSNALFYVSIAFLALAGAILVGIAIILVVNKLKPNKTLTANSSTSAV
jgi:hypothetical protein